MTDIVLDTVEIAVEPNLISGSISYVVTAQGTTGIVKNKKVGVTEMKIQMKPGIVDAIVPNTLIFTWNGLTYVDKGGRIVHSINIYTGVGTQVGTINYKTGIMTLTDWPSNTTGTLTVLSMATTNDASYIYNLSFRTAGAPIRPGGLQITATTSTGRTITGQANFNGEISGDGVYGSVDQANGAVMVVFCDDASTPQNINDTRLAVAAGSVRYHCVLYSTVPLDAELIGLDPVRLPSDGRVPIYRSGDIAVLNHWAEKPIGTLTDNQVITLDRQRVAEVIIEDSDGLELDPAQYTVDRELGKVTMGSPLLLQTVNATPLTPPFSARDRIEHMSLVSDVQVSGIVTLVAPTGHEYPANETTFSSAVVYGDLQARAHTFFSQKTFSLSSPVWLDALSGPGTTSQYNVIDYPIEVSNRGAISERWALVFVSTTDYQIVGEKVGIIGTGSIATDCAPINLNTGVPYFAVRKGGWGSGWASGNAVRFNTDGALAPLWVARVITTGAPTADNDGLTLQIRGDAD